MLPRYAVQAERSVKEEGLGGLGWGRWVVVNTCEMYVKLPNTRMMNLEKKKSDRTTVSHINTV